MIFNENLYRTGQHQDNPALQMNEMIEVLCKILQVKWNFNSVGIFFIAVLQACVFKKYCFIFQNIPRTDLNFCNISSLPFLPIFKSVKLCMLWGKVLQSGALQEKFSRVPKYTNILNCFLKYIEELLQHP